MEGMQRPHNRILWERSQQKQTLARHPRSARAVGSSHLFGEDDLDPLAWVLSIACGFVAVGFVAKVVANTVVRLRELQASTANARLEARLERMEAALDAIAIEVERAGELQRFTARVQQGSVSESPRLIARPITPH
jgi:Zn-dependent protease with chaperone function